MTMHAYANPTSENYNAAGYGLVRFNKDTRKITLECWPRHVDVSKPGLSNIPVGPSRLTRRIITVVRPLAYLPALSIIGQESPWCR